MISQNARGIAQMRNDVKNFLRYVQQEHSIGLPVEILKELIFGKINIDGEEVVYPEWHGEFLRKLDLSELPFDNVCFDLKRVNYAKKKQIAKIGALVSYGVDPESIDFDIFMYTWDLACLKPKEILNEVSEAINRLESFLYADFSETNIQIDFSRINGSIISGVNFSGVDLSKANGETLESACDCNLSNTGINLGFDNKSL